MNIIETNPPLSPKVSVLVPVYNTSQYLPECLNSLLEQTLHDIEFICLNDGSTDSSLDILKHYQEKDSRIRIVDKENTGYGSTMNLGISLARGSYLGILESDDFAERNMFKKLYRFAVKNDCDLVKCNYYEYGSNGDIKQTPFSEFRYRKVFNPRDNIWVTCVLPIIWAAIYRRSMIVDNEIRFNETPGASFQDTSFVFQCWTCAKRAALLPNKLIHYRVNNSNSSVKSSTKVLAVCDEYTLSQKFIEQDPERFAVFGEIIHLLKLGTYKWNYGRIDSEGKLEFANRMAAEYREAQDRGLLNKDLFNDFDWKIIQEIMNDPEYFVKSHPDNVYE